MDRWDKYHTWERGDVWVSRGLVATPEENGPFVRLRCRPTWEEHIEMNLEEDTRVWTRYSWHRTGNTGGLLWTQ